MPFLVPQTDAVLAAGVLPQYSRLLVSPHHNLRKEVSWAISNITAGNKDQIQQVIDGGLLPHLVEVLGQVSDAAQAGADTDEIPSPPSTQRTHTFCY